VQAGDEATGSDGESHVCGGLCRSILHLLAALRFERPRHVAVRSLIERLGCGARLHSDNCGRCDGAGGVRSRGAFTNLGARLEMARFPWALWVGVALST